MADLSLDGLASGLGTEQIINQLMQLEYRSIRNLEQEKSSLDGSKSAWRDINSRLDNLADKMTDLKLSSTFNSNSAESSNSEVVTATATSDVSAGDYQVDVNSVAQTHRLGATTKISDIDNALSDELGTAIDGDISVNGTNIIVNTDETLSSLKTKINDANKEVAATIIDGNLVLESNETGAANEITLSDNANNLLDNLGLNGDLSDINNDSVLQVAQNAEIEINGITGITSSNNTFSDAVEGVTFIFSSDDQSDDSATISVSQDTEKATSVVQDFVDQYNSVMDFINTNLDYNPETEEAGKLQGDSTLMRLQRNLRNMVTERVTSGNDYNQLASVGIEVDRDGVMTFNSDEMTEALENSSTEVMNLFNAEQEEEGFNGVATKMDSYVDQLIQSNTGTIPRQLEFYDNRMESINEDIEDQERRINSVRESWLQQQLSSLGGTSSLISSLT